MRRRLDGFPRPVAGLLVLTWLLGGCNGGGEASAGTEINTMTVSGTVTFDFVPIVGVSHDYEQTEARPARAVIVEAIRDEEVIATATTDDAGRYQLSLPVDTPIVIRASAESRRDGTPGWHYRVVDNTQGDALYVLESEERSTGRSNLTVDLHAASGWDGSSYSAPRAAAPFAILDVVHDATQFVLAAAPDTVFPPLTLHWSPSNVPGSFTSPSFTTGEIGTSLFRPGPGLGSGIYLLGAADADTDEFDRHVIAHEWGHYFEHALSRSDSIGGPHTHGDQLDLRTAFSEGFANALAAMITGDPVYVDVLGPGQAQGFAFDIEGASSAHANPRPGWFSEQSVQEIVYDVFDSALDGADTLQLGFGPILEVMTDDVRMTPALTSIYAFADALRTRRPDAAPAIDTLLAAHSITPGLDAYGTGEANAGTPHDPARVESGDILPIYKELTLGVPAVVCSTDAYNYGGATGAINKLGSRAFLKFATTSSATYAFTATTIDLPEGAKADPDLVLHQRGPLAVSEGSPDETLCTAETPQGCVERFERFLGPGDYVLEVYEWTNTQSPDGDYPPIGRTCFEVGVLTQ